MSNTLGALSESGLISIRTGPFGSALHAHEYVEEGVSVIPTEAIAEGTISKKKLTYIPAERAKELERYRVLPGNIVFARRGAQACGLSALVKADLPEAIAGTGIIALRIHDTSAIDPLFLSYLVGATESVQWLKHHAIGATMPNLNSSIILSLPASIPEFHEQKSIAHILGTLDDKIELNRQMNATLEAMAQALFKSWFVDFDPVIDNALATGNPIPDELQARAEVRAGLGDKRKPLPEAIQKQFPSSFILSEEIGWIPEGWKVKSLGEKLIPTKGKNITKETITPGSVPVVAGGLTPAYYHNAYNVASPVITISASGANAGYVNLYHENIWASDCSFINKKHSNHLYSEYLFLKSRQYEISKMQQGAAQPHVYPKDLMRLVLPDAPYILWDHLERAVIPFFERFKLGLREIRSLSELRDTLLPKLLSGQLRIPDAEKLAEKVVA